ncbi:tyrosinase-like protein 1 [Saccostrea echinata]|uniref:tyrosinase-like protein 1 n=1 Tax=Saccostrea echinata TaxID=191078 RepID=UPI002A82DEA4|nr:tyrosinase-like protein 1 [Saccostrea echinata]XP_061166340.1 tyrosinase-like protein 1 [Saccostrea echinata]
MANIWRESILFLFISLIFFKISSALLEPTPFPNTLRQCYELRSYNMTPSDETAIRIQNDCYKQYHYQQIAEGKIWSGPNVTQEGKNYINSLFRQLYVEVNKISTSDKSQRHKRQVGMGRRRREVRSPGAFQPFAQCIQRLYNTRVQMQPPLNAYQAIASIHTGPVLGTAHGGPAFLPWHRIYLLILEIACNGIPVPYWDSTVDHDMQDPTMSVVWSEQFFGNGDGAVMTGPFQNFETVIPGDFLTREIGTGQQNSLFTKEGLASVLSRTRFQEIVEPKVGPEYIFSLEGHHNGPHNWVGGHLPTPELAAFDPVFFMHHAFIDAVWEQFRRRQVLSNINPEQDYATITPPGHGPMDLMDFRPYNFQLRNINGLSQTIANLVRYEPFPTCENNCNSSPFMSCDPTRGVCVSQARPTAMLPLGIGGAASFASQPGQLAASLNAPSVSRLRAQARGPIRGGGRFRSSPFTDTRNRPNTIGNAPVAPELQAFSAQLRSGGRRKRRDISKEQGTNTSLNEHVQPLSSLERAYTNTFIIDGVVDVTRWVYVPVRVIYSRSSNSDGIDPTLGAKSPRKNPKENCIGVSSGASKVYVASGGLNYFGNYKDFTIIDERQPISITTTAVGIKNPDYGKGEVLFTAYDSCGRPCRPLCLTPGQTKQKYKPCSGVFKISTATPKMYKFTYKDIFTVNGLEHNIVDVGSLESSPTLVFVCGNDKIWPWEY